jgi:putative ABC transport system ATP-binding protein
MDSLSDGSLLVDGVDIGKFNKTELTHYRRTEVGFVFQFYNLMPNLSAIENVELSTELKKDSLDPLEVLTSVGLEDRVDNFPSQLSGGEQQRVAIARAIVNNPQLLLCDEPTGALDKKTGAHILKLLFDIGKEYHKTVIIVTHNAKIADCAQRLIRISDGKIASDEINPNPIRPEDVEW